MKAGDENLTQMAYRKIKEMMFNYPIVPGQRLVFVDFAERLGVESDSGGSFSGIGLRRYPWVGPKRWFWNMRISFRPSAGKISNDPEN